MGKEARRRARTANDTKIIEATERERIALAMFMSDPRFFMPADRKEHRSYDRLFDDLDLDDAEAVRMEAVKKYQKESKDDPPWSTWSDELEEFSTTMEVIEFFLKATDAKMVGAWARELLPLEERALALKEGSYTAPSVKEAIAAAAPAEAAKP